ncbi:MAG: 50S ribosomal protein L28 [Deltaproteobacteria bacterium]|nr:50S ribosomal protein L28 [Deltaproteobacteria bacterium]
MARRCMICGKGALTGHNVSHSNRKTPKRSHPNVRRVRARIHGGTQRILVCTRCLRSGVVQKAA